MVTRDQVAPIGWSIYRMFWKAMMIVMEKVVEVVVQGAVGKWCVPPNVQACPGLWLRKRLKKRLPDGSGRRGSG